MAYNERTSKRVASIAGRLLGRSESTPLADLYDSIAASALTQAPDKKEDGKTEKRPPRLRDAFRR